MKRVLLLVIDGITVAPKPDGLGLDMTGFPRALDDLQRLYPHTFLQCTGNAVGLAQGEPSSPQVGYFSIGAGRVIYQSVSKINLAIADGSFFSNAVLLSSISRIKKTGGTLRFAGHVQASGHPVAQIEHLIALLSSCREQHVENMTVHLMSEVATNDMGATAVSEDEIRKLEQFGAAVTESESVSDAFNVDDVVIFFDWRGDLARDALHACAAKVPSQINEAIVTLTEYEHVTEAAVLYPSEKAIMPLARVLSEKGVRQIHIGMESNQMSITHYFNGGRDGRFAGEVWRYCQSDMMTETVVQAMFERKCEFVLAGYPAEESDHLWESENSSVKQSLTRILETAEKMDYLVCITSSYGSASLAPCIFVHQRFLSRKIQLPTGSLADIAPTVISWMELPQARIMTGRNLLAGVA